jgi:hypothetical protein
MDLVLQLHHTHHLGLVSTRNPSIITQYPTSVTRCRVFSSPPPYQAIATILRNPCLIHQSNNSSRTFPRILVNTFYAASQSLLCTILDWILPWLHQFIYPSCRGVEGLFRYNFQQPASMWLDKRVTNVIVGYWLLVAGCWMRTKLCDLIWCRSVVSICIASANQSQCLLQGDF